MIKDTPFQMIEVHARLPYGSVFLAGEVVECHVTFHSPFTYSQKQSQSNRYNLQSYVVILVFIV